MLEMRDSIKRIEAGLFGNESMDQPGLVARVKNHGQRIKRLERVMGYIVCTATVIAGIYHVAMDLWQRH